MSLLKGGHPLPKPTFFNLTQDKKDNLLHAVEKEFSRVPLYEASIANIVKTARIPRGSFYQYFKDKEDAYFYLLNEQVEEKKAKFIQSLKEYDGDLFEAVTQIFKLSIKENPNDQGIQILKNTFLDMTHEIEETFKQMINVNRTVEQLAEIKQLIDTDVLNIHNREELFHLMQIISMVISHNLIEKYAKDLTYEEEVNNFSMKMNCLRSRLFNNNGN